MWLKRKENNWRRKSKRTTYCCSIHKEWVEFYEEASAFFGAGLLVHVSVEITELTEGWRQIELYNAVNVQFIISFSILVQDFCVYSASKNEKYTFFQISEGVPQGSILGPLKFTLNTDRHNIFVYLSVEKNWGWGFEVEYHRQDRYESIGSRLTHSGFGFFMEFVENNTMEVRQYPLRTCKVFDTIFV